MRPALLLAALLLLSGCGASTQPPVGDRFLNEQVDSTLEPFADLLWAEFRELNGSVILVMEFRNMSGVIPEFTATFTVETADGDSVQFLRNQPNRSRQPSQLEYVHGRVQGDSYVPEHEVCATTEVTDPPWRLRVEAEHRYTGLDAGGRIRGLEIQTGDFEDHPQDHAESDGTFEVRGGPNPYASCPIIHERPE